MSGGAALRADLQEAPGAAQRRACPVCGERSATMVSPFRYALFDDSHLPASTTVVACDGCGTVFADSDATSADYRRHYARQANVDPATAAGGVADDDADAERLAAVVECLVPYLPADARILDVGAGRGGLLRLLAAAGRPSLTGLDPSSGCVAAMRSLGIDAHVCELEDAAWPVDPQRFDCIVLSHVLERVVDATTALRGAAARVADGGRIYIEAADASRYTTRGFPPFYFFDSEHINHFDRGALTTLAARLGWTVESAWQRDVSVAPGQRFPVVAVLLVRDGEGRGEAMRDEAASAAAERVRRYVVDCRSAAATATDGAWIARMVASRQPLVLWGAGSHAQRLLAQTALGECAIDCIIDDDVGKQGRTLAGRPVVSLDEGLKRAHRIDANIAIAIAVGADAVVTNLRRRHPALRVRVL